ncbi:MAG TPA: FMN-binding protein [Bryobacteraceae bacterium]|nr:FMN-binding protein [Bryobacteraceae bacterium]
MTQGGSNKKVANSLVSASCAAVLAVYVAGYTRTQAAADRFANQGIERRRATPNLPRAAIFKEDSRTAAPNAPGVPAPPISSQPKEQAVRKTIQPEAPEKALPIPRSVAADASPVVSPAPAVASQSAQPVVTQAAEPAAPVPQPKAQEAAPTPPVTAWKDGTYTGLGDSPHGDIEATVVIAGGRIQSATISQCRTLYSCSVIDRLPPQVAERQSPDVDYVSGATHSAEAFYAAVVEALDQAKLDPAK